MPGKPISTGASGLGDCNRPYGGLSIRIACHQSAKGSLLLKYHGRKDGHPLYLAQGSRADERAQAYGRCFVLIWMRRRQLIFGKRGRPQGKPLRALKKAQPTRINARNLCADAVCEWFSN